MTMQRAEMNERGNYQTLESLLIMPIQRIPRYTLLLENLVKGKLTAPTQTHSHSIAATNSFHVDFPKLEKALEMLHELADTMNEGKRAVDSFDKVLAIHKLLRYNKAARSLVPHMH